MATNQMRREAAKRKLARQQERRVQQAARRKRLVVVASVSAVVLVVAAVGGYAIYRAVRGPVAECTYAAAEPAARPVDALDELGAPSAGTVSTTLTTNRGAIPLTLDRAKAPCTVASFLHLAESGYFDATTCHRLTTEGIKVLQCGDPSGEGNGGPGYSIADETTPDLTYGRGTLAMANSGPDTSGSQFFMVYGDSQLSPDYTVFGSVEEPGLAVIDQIAAAGLADGAVGDGKPAEPVTIESVQAG